MDQQQHQVIKTEGIEPSLNGANTAIELVEHTPGTIAIEEAVGVTEDVGEWVQEGDQMKRVKVYELIGSRWVDQGTAFCFGQFQEDSGEALLIARSERDFNDVILRTVIRSNDVYQRQQDTLIVWTEPDGVDYALSFQDPEGCSEVWNFITEVQQHMNNAETNGLPSSPVLGPEGSVTTASIIRSGHLPSPQLGIIGEIERAIKALSRTQPVKERICEYIQQEEYIKSLIDVLRAAEDLESLENLHALCSLMQTILMLNDHTLYEHILEDDIFYGVVGMLEYDPDFPTHKANYRDFLKQAARFRQPIPMQEEVIQRKIHHTYRLQFLKDVVLARALDDSTFNVLNSCIIFNQIDIITHIQSDQMFLKEIVRLFVDEDVLIGGAQRYQIQLQMMQQQQQQMHQMHQRLQQGPDDSMDVDTAPKPIPSVSPPASAPISSPTAYSFAPPDDLTEAEINQRREVVLLIQQLCIMGKNVQLPARMALFRVLVDRGILFAVQWAMNSPEVSEVDKQMIAAGGEILSALLDHDLNGVRGHVLKQIMAIEKERAAGKRGADKAETLLEMVCRIMARSKDLAVQSLVGDALKVWMDIPSEIPPAGAGEAHAIGASKMPARKDDSGTERFLEYFYKECVHILFKPLVELQEWKSCKDNVLALTREQSNRYVYLCDLLYNFIQQHNFRSNFYVLSSNNILSRVATLLRAKDKYLRHASFRIFRLLLRQNNAHIHGLVMKHDVIKPILNLTLQESRRDNLLSCSCQEYFESMRRDNMKELIKFCMIQHEEDVRKLAETPLGGQRFELLIRRPTDTRPRPDQTRSLEAEEESYFNADDDEDDGVLPSISQQARASAMGSLIPVPSSALSPGKLLSANSSINPLKRKRRGDITARGRRPPLRSPAMKFLADYGEDEEEGSEAKQEGSDGHDSKAVDSNSTLAPSPIPMTGGLAGGPPGRPVKNEDDEDSTFDTILRGRTTTPGPRPQSPASTLTPPVRGGKRRRVIGEEDDDDEMLSRLTKPKKPQFVFAPIQQNKTTSVDSVGGPGNQQKNGETPPRKIKVKLGGFGSTLVSGSSNTTPSVQPSGMAVDPPSNENLPQTASSPSPSQSPVPSPSPSPAPSETGIKDGDTG
ncbi:hypothetical protein AGABI1DRAFT_72653 [Agaricus bisporus var. burnettii JB137-S8]|uniref:Uncharacterized protein n=1 Tax=Agaricus bisporus var. burnettii (strain JB137-S8 / ATCC MYA-4627 / FGSC 10392) TaxID=597362 RepID=K5VZJ1_AGABU|nr:uncharacterized protein AGABI1DRAFT_72653 [Agaricus bisporus var. burnettii JB137-S8]EKM79939.1 hypothetical protein AGABI1DRAFT_72653 [Agaricus bisporus var. burnettii JB137-S8]